MTQWLQLMRQRQAIAFTRGSSTAPRAYTSSLQIPTLTLQVDCCCHVHRQPNLLSHHCPPCDSKATPASSRRQTAGRIHRTTPRDPCNTVKTASNGDDAPRADGAAAPANQAPPISPTSPGPATAPKGPISRFAKPVMQSMSSLPDTRQQSFDEIYGPPENFLEIEVCSLPTVPSLPRRFSSHAMSCDFVT